MSRNIYSILFADIQGFTKFSIPQQEIYINDVVPKIARVIHDNGRYKGPEQANTWGDGIVAFFDDKIKAAGCALELRDYFRTTDWERMFGLPQLKIRIALSEGTLFENNNPIKLDIQQNTRDQIDLIGTEINRASRLEPIVKANHVYATKSFAFSDEDKVEELPGIIIESIGKQKLAKGWKKEEVFFVGRKDMDSNIDIKTLMQSLEDDFKGIDLFPENTRFGQRLTESKTAKQNLADYCMKKDLWRSEDVVFIDSGTIPIYVIRALLKQKSVEKWPKLLMTNNIGCLIVKMIHKEDSKEGSRESPEMVLTGGRIYDDYGTTIPGSGLEPESFLKYLRDMGVNNVILMVTKLSSDLGPCSREEPTRQFKRMLLQYVAGYPDISLTILLQIEKLYTEDSKSKSLDEKMAEGSGDRYWERIIQQKKKIRIICACSPETTYRNFAKAIKELTKLRDMGITCTLLDNDDGEEIPFD